jgi:hypothetical protein
MPIFLAVHIYSNMTDAFLTSEQSALQTVIGRSGKMAALIV